MDSLAVLHKDFSSKKYGKHNAPTPERLVRRYEREVAEELQRCMTMVRWQPLAKNIIGCRLLVRHAIEPLLLDHYARSHPRKTILLESGQGTFAYIPGKPVKHYALPLYKVVVLMEKHA